MKLLSYVFTKNDDHIIGKCLERLSESCDGIIVVEDGSTDNTFEIVSSYSKVVKVFRNPPNKIFNPFKDLNKIMEVINEIKPEWVMAADSDDIIDKRFGADRDKYLSRKEIGRYHFREITLWGSNKYYRVDKPEIYMRNRGKTPFLVRWNPEFKFLDPYEKFPASLVRYLRQTWAVGILKRYFRKVNFEKTNSKTKKIISTIFWNPDFIDYANTFVTGYKGREEELPFVKIHYHFENLYHAWRKHLNYALQTATRHHRSPDEIPYIVDWASEKLNDKGIILKEVEPEWGVL